ncbi:MAG: hypothetical protein BMS9Abin29_0807 [Gemmatimonadota bacterium]|nr:MAG: hypothetical protein BMS9Abin29_0807 [Gemmatimonadota bacterium]
MGGAHDGKSAVTISRPNYGNISGPMTSFQRQVYALVAQVPRGRVLSYGAVAALLGRPRSARAVGGALSLTPDDLELPWWRVISSSGRISTSPIHHTAQVQRALLEDEGVEFDEGGRIDFERFEWDVAAHYDSTPAPSGNIGASASHRSGLPIGSSS